MSLEDIKNEVRSYYAGGSPPNWRAGGFIFPDGDIVWIGEDDHSIINIDDQLNYGIITFRITNRPKTLFIRVQGRQPTDEQEKALLQLQILLKPWDAVIDIYDSKGNLLATREIEHEVLWAHDLPDIIDRIIRKEKLKKRLLHESKVSSEKLNLKSFLMEAGIYEGETPKHAGFILPNGEILEIGPRTHNVVNIGLRKKLGVIDYRLGQTSILPKNIVYLKIYGIPTKKQQEIIDNWKKERKVVEFKFFSDFR